MQKKEFLEDVKALGGLPLYVVLTALFFIMGYSAMSVGLIICLVLSYCLTMSIRFLFFRQRPDKESFRGFAQKIDASSFPSLHSMRSSCLAVLLMIFFSNIWVSVIMTLGAVGVAVVRVVQKRHFPSDVIAGLIFGVVIAWIAIWFQSFL